MHAKVATNPLSITPYFVNEVESPIMAHLGGAEGVGPVVEAPLQDHLDPLVAEGEVVVAPSQGVMAVVVLLLHVPLGHRAFH